MRQCRHCRAAAEPGAVGMSEMASDKVRVCGSGRHVSDGRLAGYDGATWTRDGV